MTTTVVALYCWFVGGTIALVCLIAWARAADRRIEEHVQAALTDEATDFGEPARTWVESCWLDEATNDFWLFPADEFRDTPIFRQLRHEEDVRFAASVLADIDDLAGGVV